MAGAGVLWRQEQVCARLARAASHRHLHIRVGVHAINPIPSSSRYIGVYKDAITAVAAYDLAKRKLEACAGNKRGETPEAIFDRVRKSVKEEMAF